MHDFDIVSMRDRAGAVVRGYDNPSAVYDNIIQALFDFYESEGRVFVPQHVRTSGGVESADFHPRIKRYKHKVYTGELPASRTESWRLPNRTIVQRRFPTGEAPLHGFINSEYLGNEIHLGGVVLEWDFPQGRSVYHSENFSLYFDLINKDLSVRKEERDKFVRYILSD